MTLESWKEKIYAGLVNLRMRKEEMQAKTIYGLVAGSTFWPVIQAAQAGDWAAFAALGTVAGGLGGGLLANKIQEWKDNVNGEADAVQLIQQEIESSVELREAVDEVLENLDVLKQAEVKQTSAEDKAWFRQALRDELTVLGNLQRFEVFVTIDDGSEKKAQDAQTRYLTNFRKEALLLPLTTLGDEISTKEDVTLEAVYISLDTRTPLRDQDRKGAANPEAESEEEIALRIDEENVALLSAQEAADQNKRFVLLGDPGSGKSTFVKQYLAKQATTVLSNAGSEAPLIPVLVILRDLVPALQALNLNETNATANRQALTDLVRAQILHDLDKTYRAKTFATGLEAALDQGNCLLVFDGLDEVPQHLRKKVRAAVHAVLKTYAIERCIITSRIRSYRGDAVFTDFEDHTLAPLKKDKIQHFAKAWYNAQTKIGRIEEGAREARIKDLQQAALEPSIRKLATNPMLLLTLTMVHQRKARLPKERVVLYDEAIDLMASRWQKEKGETVFVEYPVLSEFVDDKQAVRGVMEQLAYEAHRAGRNKKTADLSREKALAVLEKAFGELAEGPTDYGLPAAFLDYVDQRSGLLVGRGGEEDSPHPANYSFPHRTFQEYLAGCYAITNRDARTLLPKLAEEDDYWSLAVQLGGEDLKYNRRMPNVLLERAMQLCPENCKSLRAARCALWGGRMATEYGVVKLKEDKEGAVSGAKFLKNLQKRLVQVLKSKLPPIERAEAGVVLSELGDPRKEVMRCEDMAFCFVPKGSFWMGSDEGEDMVYSREQPKHEVELTYDYWIARFPVTVSQLKQYAEETDKDVGNEYTFTGPINHPVARIKWYEANDFCNWLTDVLQQQAADRLKKKLKSASEIAMWEGLRDGALVAYLPSEAEWEKAARGINDSRLYPWGGEPDADKMNYHGTGIGTRSTVGCFPRGKSPYHVEEMAGNVLEWCRDWFGEKIYNKRAPSVVDPGGPNSGSRRVLRGGAFSYDQRLVRCAYRVSGDPRLRSYSVGYRIILLPSRIAYEKTDDR